MSFSGWLYERDMFQKIKQNIYSVYTCEAREEAANRLCEFTATGRSNITSA